MNFIKKTVKYAGIILLAVLLALISVPFLFKEKIKQLLLTEIDKNIKAQVNFSTLEFSSFKKFPRFSVELNDPVLIGINEFAGDTLVFAKSIEVSLNIMKLLKGHVEIKGIDLENPMVYLRVLKNGDANYNITSSSDTTTGKTPAAEKKFNIAIDKWSITNGRIIYDDKLQKTFIAIGGLYHNGSGDFEQDISNLDITTRVTDLTLHYNDINYFTKKKFAADLQMELNVKDKKFTFKDHNFQLGEFKFGFEGFFKILKSGYQTDLKFVVKETKFKNILSLLPGVYQKDMEGIDTRGDFSLNGFVKGIYDAAHNKVPDFHIDLQVINAYFKYQHLPKALENINLELIADNTSGDPENSTYHLKKFHVEMDKEPIDATLFLKGKNNKQIKADIKLKANLSEIEKMYPIKDITLRGMLKSEIKIEGIYNAEKKLFPKTDAFITLEQGYVKSSQSPIDMDSIATKIEVQNPSGNLSDTKVNVSSLTFLLDHEPFVMSGSLLDMKDYNYQVQVDGLLDLAKLTQVYPLSNTKLSGTVDIDIKTSGNLSDIEAKKYTQLQASGTVEMKNVSYKNSEIAFPIHIDDALLSFNAHKIDLTRFKAEFGKSNLLLGGHVYDYVPFIIRPDAPIKGELIMQCDTIDLNEWFPSSAPTATVQVNTHTVRTQTIQPQVASMPGNLSFTFDSDIKKIIFGQMEISNLDGEIRIANGVLTLNETGFNTLDSKMKLSGSYHAQSPQRAAFDMNIDIAKLDFNKAYKTFVDAKSNCPAAGNFSTQYKIKGELNPDYSPIYSSLAGSGLIHIDSVAVKGMKLMNHLKNISKKQEFNDPNLRDVSISSEIKNGKFVMKPFSFQISKFLTEVEGDQGLADESLNYLIKLSVLPFTKIKIPVSITGTSSKPDIKIGKGFNASDFDKL
ncbi:MAG: AsmA family protein [Bacteroidetes bacterium]|nr:AsmA family protein [Bacteroidota bacterium]